MKPGSLPWLLKHELRLAWREMTAETSVTVIVLFGAALFIGLHIGLWFAVRAFRGLFVVDALSPDVLLWMTVGLFVVFSFVLAQAIGRSTVALFERGDLDLLVSSPIASKVIFATRVLGVALQLVITLAIIAVPLGNAALMLGLPRLLGIYPVIIGMALSATAIGILLTILLVRLVGARRARTVVQVCGTLIGVSIFLFFQLPNILGPERLSGLIEWLHVFASLFEAGELFGPQSVIWFPARALFFDPLSILLSIALGGALLWFTVTIAHKAYISGTGQPLTSGRTRVPRRVGTVRFSRGLTRTFLHKEWRLILRDPYIITQVLRQMVFTIPLFAILFFGNGEMFDAAILGAAVGAFGIVLGGTLVSNITRICVAGEDAAELLRASPVSKGMVRRFKVIAALVPIVVFFSPLYLVFIVRGELHGLTGFFCFVVATLAAALMTLWTAKPVKRADLFNRRGRKANATLWSYFEFPTLLAWAAAAFAIAQGSWWAWPAIAAGTVLPAVVYVAGRRRRAAVSC